MSGWWWLGLPILLVALAWALFRGPTVSGGPPEPPEQVVKRRYAKGEIDRDTYQRMLADLRGS